MTKPRPALFGPDTTEPCAVVSWEGPGQPIVLRISGAGRDIAVPLTPKRALALAVELTQRAVLTIKVNQWGSGWPG